MIILKKYWISTLVVIIILILCFINPADIPVDVPMTNFDKLAHFLMFMGLSGVIFFDNSYYLKKRVSGNSIFWVSFVFPIIFSGVIEIAQEYLTVTRTGDWMDFLFNLLGISFGYLVCLVINRQLKAH